MAEREVSVCPLQTFFFNYKIGLTQKRKVSHMFIKHTNNLRICLFDFENDRKCTYQL